MSIGQLVPTCFLVLGLALTSGCQDAETRQANKPIIEADTTTEVEEAADAVGEDLDEAASDVADTVTPDEPIVDIETPLGDVKVGSDPATGRTNVDVETNRADVSVSE